MSYTKQRIIDEICKDIQTVTIGALNRFQEQFAHLWGDRDEVDSLTEKQKEFREKWLKAREEILDFMHFKFKQIKNRLKNYNIQYKDEKITLNLTKRRKYDE